MGQARQGIPNTSLPGTAWIARRLAILAGAIFALSLTANQAGADGERRYALVIGNGAYSFAPLKNPVNDARAVAASLRRLGFDVDLRENIALPALLEALRQFAFTGHGYDVRLFYYGGHGMQLDGKNYLLPVDTDIKTEQDLPTRSADLGEFLERVGQFSRGLNILILDACRNNPFSGDGVPLADGRRVRFRGAVPGGLAPVEAPRGTLVAYSTAPGAIALDGAGGRHSLYTEQLLEQIDTPGLPVEQLFKRVRIAVAAATRRQQVPWENSSLMGDFCFRAMSDGRCAHTADLFSGGPRRR
jgi:uncharacterized caspase-like protein